MTSTAAQFTTNFNHIQNDRGKAKFLLQSGFNWKIATRRSGWISTGRRKILISFSKLLDGSVNSFHALVCWENIRFITCMFQSILVKRLKPQLLKHLIFFQIIFECNTFEQPNIPDAHERIISTPQILKNHLHSCVNPPERYLIVCFLWHHHYVSKAKRSTTSFFFIIIIVERKCERWRGGGGVRSADRKLVSLVSLGQSFEDGIDFLSDGRQRKLKLVLQTER